jgi:DNA repair exonuclease SbcCD ATPase subunit
MGLFRRRDGDEQLAVLRAEVRAVHEQLDLAERSRADLASDLERLNGQLDTRIEAQVDAQIVASHDRPITATPAPPPPPPPLPPPDTTAPDSAVTDTATPDAASVERIERIEERLGEIAASNERLDERVTNVTTELANQLTELSTDLDYVAQGLPPGTTVSPLDPEMIEARLRKQLDEEIDAKLGIELDDVRDNAERLALEQARYEIRFRQDLAELADRMRRPGAD